MGPITLFACEAQPIVVEGLLRLCAISEEFSVVGTATSYTDALARIPALQPRIALADQSGGLKLLLRLLADLQTAAPGVATVLWVQDLPESECFRALQLGVRGVWKKTMPAASLVDCLRAVARGEVWLENAFAGSTPGFLQRRQIPRLTPREREIVRCLSRGLRNKEIAQELSITAGTVKVHLMHIFEKTGVKDRFELAVHGRALLGPEADPTEAAANGTPIP